ncbi:MAG: hypothetical protein H0W02_21895 [Ktedonobacteraceae bacterium]|nr:hypothetical protein [Ktedonobacteraceae bacterium]
MKGFISKDNPSPSLSVGIAIVHHLELLQEALSSARTAERRAKSVDGKNALAIIVSKRSGEDYSSAGQWDDVDRFLEELIGSFRRGLLPKGTAYELRTMVQRLAPPGGDSRDRTGRAVMRTDAWRILYRKMTVPREKQTALTGEDDLKKILNQLIARIEPGEEPALPASQVGRRLPDDTMPFRPVPIEEFIDELIIAEFLADARNLAAAGQTTGEGVRV